MSIGENIKEVAEIKGVTPYKISKEAGISNSYLSDLLRNKSSNPSIEILKKIADALDVSVMELIK